MDMIIREAIQMLDNGTLVDAEALVKGFPGCQMGGGITGGKTVQTSVRDELRLLDFSFPDAQVNINGVAAGTGDSGVTVRPIHVSVIRRIHSIIQRSSGKEHLPRFLCCVFAFFHVAPR